MPTFIQDEQGMLVAVYQPDALDRLLAGSECDSASATPRLPHVDLPDWSPVMSSLSS